MRDKTGIYCNGCGKRIAGWEKEMHEDFLHVEKAWGYFSNKDQERHSFDLCEACYDKLLEGFVKEAQTEEMTELL